MKKFLKILSTISYIVWVLAISSTITGLMIIPAYVCYDIDMPSYFGTIHIVGIVISIVGFSIYRTEQSLYEDCYVQVQCTKKFADLCANVEKETFYSFVFKVKATNFHNAQTQVEKDLKERGYENIHTVWVDDKCFYITRSEIEI